MGVRFASDTFTNWKCVVRDLFLKALMVKLPGALRTRLHFEAS